MKKLNKQERIVRRRKQILFTVIILFISVLSLTVFSINSSAKDSKEVYKYYTSYEIKAGDSLWSIADDHMTPEFHDKEAYIREVKQLNHLLNDNITAGEHIVIAYYSYDIL